MLLGIGMTEYEKMLRGMVFDGADAEISAVRDETLGLLKQINELGTFRDARSKFERLFGRIGSGSVVTPPFRCEFGKHIEVGVNTFINFGAIVLDGATVTIGNNVLIGPNTQLYTSTHSTDYLSRRHWQTFCKPIVLEDGVWIGGNVVINQGVTIGARSIVATSSVVNHDVPPDCLVGGVPGKVIKRLDKANVG